MLLLLLLISVTCNSIRISLILLLKALGLLAGYFEVHRYLHTHMCTVLTVCDCSTLHYATLHTAVHYSAMQCYSSLLHSMLISSTRLYCSLRNCSLHYCSLLSSTLLYLMMQGREREGGRERSVSHTILPPDYRPSSPTSPLLLART